MSPRRRAPAAAVALLLAGLADASAAAREDSRLDDTPRAPADVPRRPAPLLELGEPFLETGPLGDGIRLPTGATWRPALMLFGTLRTALQAQERGPRAVEWANRLDLFMNLRLSGTERLLVGVRPLDRGGRVSGYFFEPDAEKGWHDAMNVRLETAFFEGDLGEIFPRLDRADRRPLDVGFAIGRQPLSAQDGMLLADTVDSLGIVRNTLRPGGASNVRVTGVLAWNDLHRRSSGGFVEDDGARMIGLFTTTDVPSTTLSIDAAGVFGGDGGDGIVVGASGVQRLGPLDTTFRALASAPTDGTRDGALDKGTLVASELSWTPGLSHDVVYVNAFAAFGTFTSAARDPTVGGPLARIGVLYEAPGMGRASSALDGQARDAAGFAVGYQRVMADGRRQLLGELAAREDTDSSLRGEAAAGLRFQQALGRRTILQLDGHAGRSERLGPTWGARFEILVKF